MSQLKKALGAAVATQQIPPQLDATLEWVVEPDQVLGVRVVEKGQHSEKEVLIQWKGLPAFEASWESCKSICQHFPDFHLEDKVVLETG